MFLQLWLHKAKSVDKADGQIIQNQFHEYCVLEHTFQKEHALMDFDNIFFPAIFNSHVVVILL